MSRSESTAQIERFRSLIARHLGLYFEEAKLPFLGEVLQRRIESTAQPCDTYIQRLEANAPRSELALLAQQLTVGETHFFRNTDQFRAFSQVVVPDRLRAQAFQKRLRILSAGCASGEEAYSVAILIREAGFDSSCDVSILAVDVNPTMIEKARRAQFTTWALRETPSETQQKWFRLDGRDVFLSDSSVHAAVRFEERNLVEDDSELWRPDTYDVIFCRNVIMYFTPESSRAVVGYLTRALAPGGYLFLGHAETLRALSQDFHLCHTHGTFYYQRKDRVEHSANHRAAHSKPFPGSPPAELASIVESSDTWVEAIGKAAERIQALTETSGKFSKLNRDSAPAQSQPGWDLAITLELLKKERFAEALEVLQSMPPESFHDPDVLLLRAVLLTHGGRLKEAEGVCHDLLAVDELNAGAHYVLALCSEGESDKGSAVDHDQVAVYLDPSFAMPHMHLGLIARRRGDRNAAQRELGQALALLQQEDAARLLLFGGGFSRDALLGLCRAELSASGGLP